MSNLEGCQDVREPLNNVEEGVWDAGWQAADE
jgi:hypothetical protein